MNPRRDWLAGAVFGTWAGFDVVYVPPLGAILFGLFAIPSLIGRSPAAFAGHLVGTGAVMVEIVMLANWSCASAGSSGDGGCTPPDLTAWLVGGCAMAMIGTALTVRTIRHAYSTAIGVN